MSRTPSHMTRQIALLLALLFAGCTSAAEPPPDIAPSPFAPGFGALSVLAPLGENAAEPHIAARAENVVVAAMDFSSDGPGRDRTFQLVLHRSTDAGATWLEPSPLPAQVRSPFDPAAKMDYVGDPVLAYAPDGTLFLTGIAAHGAWAEGPAGPVVLQLTALTIFVTRSEDDGVTWSPAIYHRQGAGTFGFPVLFAGILEDKPWITVSPEGVLHLAWTEFVGPASSILHASSGNGGTTWSEPTTLATSGTGLVLQAATLAAPGEGRVYVSATSYRPSQEYPPRPTPGGEQMVWVSEDDGGSFGAALVVGPASQDRWGTLFAGASDPSRVFVTAPAAEEESDVYLTTSRDGGATWDEPVWLAAERAGAKVQPTGWVDAQGVPRVAFYDEGWPGGTQLVVVTVEGNGSLQTTAAPGPSIEHGTHRRDYFGVAPTPAGAWVAWTGGDGRTTWTSVAKFAAARP